jgi:hypothetical protein
MKNVLEKQTEDDLVEKYQKICPLGFTVVGPPFAKEKARGKVYLPLRCNVCQKDKTLRKDSFDGRSIRCDECYQSELIRKINAHCPEDFTPISKPFIKTRNGKKYRRKFVTCLCSHCNRKVDIRVEFFDGRKIQCTECGEGGNRGMSSKELKETTWGKLSVISDIQSSNIIRNDEGKIVSRKRAWVKCKCECGNTRNVPVESLILCKTGQAKQPHGAIYACNDCMQQSKKEALTKHDHESLKGKTFNNWKYLRILPRKEWIFRSGAKRKTVEVQCLKCEEIYSQRLDAVLDGSSKGCLECYGRIWLKKDCTKKQQQEVERLDTLYDGWTYKVFKERDQEDKWDELVSFYKSVVEPNAAGGKMASLTPKRYAAHRGYLELPHVAMNYFLRDSLDRLLANGVRDKGEWHGELDATTICFCSLEELINHIENQFEDGWTWANRGPAWHLDHIFPVSVAIKEGNGELVNHWQNLQPLAGNENLSKNDKVTPEARRLFNKLKKEFEKEK